VGSQQGKTVLPILRDWLEQGDPAEGDWAAFVVRLANRGALGRARGLLLDLAALSQPFACRSNECTPGRRDAGTRSCCADIEVTLSTRERRAIERALPELARHLRRKDLRWAEGAPPLFDGDALRRPGGTCIFAMREAVGLRCALHQLEARAGLPPGALKPIPCRLFPLALVDLGEGRRLLTAVHRATASPLGTLPARRFPCLRGDDRRPPLYRALHDTLVQFFGPAATREIARAARRYRDSSRG
jgi:hypothetical protein